MNKLVENLPIEGTVYVSCSGQRIYIESVSVLEDDFYLVNIAPAKDKDDMAALGHELDPYEWLDMVNDLGLKMENIERDEC